MGREVKSRLKRLMAYSDAHRAKRLVVLAKTADGTETEMSVDELIESKSTFIRVLRGNDLTDVYRIIDYEVPNCAIK